MPVPRILDVSTWPYAERRWRWGGRSHREAPAAEGATGEGPPSHPRQPLSHDLFWHNHYHLEPYYVSGRGYDQYRPAYELGWTAAEKCPGDFADIAPLLETQWASHRGASLLEWRQVAAAAHASWERVRSGESAGGLPEPQVLVLVQGLQRLNLQTAKSLRIAMSQAPHGFSQQVLRRHLQGFEAASRELAREFHLPVLPPAGRPFAGALRRGWESIKATLGQHSIHSLLDACEQAEKTLQLGYGAALRQGLPGPTRVLLQRQAMAVQRSINVLHWLRACGGDVCSGDGWG